MTCSSKLDLSDGVYSTAREDGRGGTILHFNVVPLKFTPIFCFLDYLLQFTVLFVLLDLVF